MRFMTRWVAVAVALVLGAGAAHALDGLTNAAILDLLSVAHMKLEAGDRPGAKADLKALSVRLADSANPAHKRWRRALSWIVIEITMGYASGADARLHELIREVSTADSTPPPPAPDDRRR